MIGGARKGTGRARGVERRVAGRGGGQRARRARRAATGSRARGAGCGRGGIARRGAGASLEGSRDAGRGAISSGSRAPRGGPSRAGKRRSGGRERTRRDGRVPTRAPPRRGRESAPSSRRRERHVPGTSGGSILSFASGAAGDAATSPPAEGAPARVSAASGVVPTGAGARGGDPGISPIAPRSVAIVTRERAPRRLRTVPTRPARRASSGAGFCELGRRPGGTTRCARVRPR